MGEKFYSTVYRPLLITVLYLVLFFGLKFVAESVLGLGLAIFDVSYTTLVLIGLSLGFFELASEFLESHKI